MDSLTHLVLGHAMGVFASGRTPAAQAGAYWGAFVGNSLPDVDVPLGYLLGKGWALHRKFTHTIPGILLLPAAAAGLITASVPGSSFGLTYAWTLAGVIVHVFLDCLNLFGTRPFWPLSNQSIGFGILFILDPFILLTVGMASAAQGFHLTGDLPVKASYVLMWLYIAVRWGAWLTLRRRIAGPDVRRAQVVPFFSLWRYLRETPDAIEYGRVSAFTGRLAPIESVKIERGPAVDASRQDPRVRQFLTRARYPYARVEPSSAGYTVVWNDLYGRLRGRFAGVEVRLDQDLQPMEQG